ncbi:hypothetical protein [Dactylosporangium salmoneum]|uniref:YCII-related domain-containing protein n=1 Tax=Dactylosporangium salmoneum TaxID=53361 RepID=A0ABP5UHZ7_9ACTN
MTKFVLLHAPGAAAPPPDAGGELMEARRLADPSLAVRVGPPPSSFGGYWIVDVDSLERAVEIAAAAGVSVEIRQVMSDRAGPDL